MTPCAAHRTPKPADRSTPAGERRCSKSAEATNKRTPIWSGARWRGKKKSTRRRRLCNLCYLNSIPAARRDGMDYRQPHLWIFEALSAGHPPQAEGCYFVRIHHYIYRVNIGGRLWLRRKRSADRLFPLLEGAICGCSSDSTQALVYTIHMNRLTMLPPTCFPSTSLCTRRFATRIPVHFGLLDDNCKSRLNFYIFIYIIFR